MKIIDQLGIDPILLAAQIVNFLIILYILKRFAYKPILTLLKTRQNTIQKGLKDAEEAHKLLEKTSEREKEVLRKAHSEAKKMLDDARAQGVELLQKSEVSTKKEAERILKDAREQIAFETREAEKRLSAHVSELAMHFLQRSLEEVFDQNEQEVVMRSAMKKLKTKKN
jgi:F-type H+-transporting ATPase subunit b